MLKASSKLVSASQITGVLPVVNGGTGVTTSTGTTNAVLSNSPTITTPTIAGATLSGTVAGGGNQINNVVIGAATPLAGNFTIVIATGAISGHAASRAVLDYASSTARVWGYGVNASTIGEVQIQLRSSNGSLGGTAATFTSTGLTTPGTISPQQATTAGAPAYVKGAIYFDTTLNKLRVGGATGWETITSV